MKRVHNKFIVPIISKFHKCWANIINVQRLSLSQGILTYYLIGLGLEKPIVAWFKAYSLFLNLKNMTSRLIKGPLRGLECFFQNMHILGLKNSNAISILFIQNKQNTFAHAF